MQGAAHIQSGGGGLRSERPPLADDLLLGLVHDHARLDDVDGAVGLLPPHLSEAIPLLPHRLERRRHRRLLRQRHLVLSDREPIAAAQHDGGGRDGGVGDLALAGEASRSSAILASFWE